MGVTVSESIIMEALTSMMDFLGTGNEYKNCARIERNYPVTPNLSLLAGWICVLVAVFGAVGNLLTLLAIPWARRRKTLGFDKTPMSKYTTIFILNLAFADFLYCSTSLPLYSLTVRFQVYPKYFSLHFSSFQEDGLGNLQRVALLQTLALLLLHFVISMLMLLGCLLGLLLLVGRRITKNIKK